MLQKWQNSSQNRVRGRHDLDVRAGERGVNGDIGARENCNLSPIVQVDTVGGGRASAAAGGLGRVLCLAAAMFSAVEFC